MYFRTQRVRLLRVIAYLLKVSWTLYAAVVGELTVFSSASFCWRLWLLSGRKSLTATHQCMLLQTIILYKTRNVLIFLQQLYYWPYGQIATPGLHLHIPSLHALGPGPAVHNWLLLPPLLAQPVEWTSSLCWQGILLRELSFAVCITCFIEWSCVQDWWTCTSFSAFYRKWNFVVHDWIKAYIYQDLKDVRMLCC